VHHEREDADKINGILEEAGISHSKPAKDTWIEALEVQCKDRGTQRGCPGKGSAGIEKGIYRSGAIKDQKQDQQRKFGSIHIKRRS
jgi:hypothetical protein